MQLFLVFARSLIGSHQELLAIYRTHAEAQRLIAAQPPELQPQLEITPWKIGDMTQHPYWVKP
jgi:hypothetical protein